MRIADGEAGTSARALALRAVEPERAGARCDCTVSGRAWTMYSSPVSPSLRPLDVHRAAAVVTLSMAQAQRASVRISASSSTNAARSAGVVGDVRGVAAPPAP